MPPESPPARRRRSSRLLAAVPLAGLTGCGGSVTNTFPPACPKAGILADAADLTRFRQNGAGAQGRDLTDMVLDGRMTGVSGTCSQASRRELAVAVTVSMQLTRGPAAKGPPNDVPFFVAVSEGGRVLDKQVFRVQPRFAANADTLRLTSDEVRLTLPVGTERTGADYDLVVGFQLSPDELAQNRRRGPR